MEEFALSLFLLVCVLSMCANLVVHILDSVTFVKDWADSAGVCDEIVGDELEAFVISEVDMARDCSTTDTHEDLGVVEVEAFLDEAGRKGKPTSEVPESAVEVMMIVVDGADTEMSDVWTAGNSSVIFDLEGVWGV